MDMTQYTSSPYLAGVDIQGMTISVVVDRVEEREVGKRKELRPVLFFQGKQKGMVLNKTNIKKIVKMYGNESEDWIGKEISLFTIMQEFEGEVGPALRVGEPMKKSKPAPAPRKPVAEYENPAEGMDDEIPF